MRILIKLKRIYRRNTKLLLLVAFIGTFILFYALYSPVAEISSGDFYRDNVDLRYKRNKEHWRFNSIAFHQPDKTFLKYSEMFDAETDISIRGINPSDKQKYMPNSEGNFVCLIQKDVISFSKVNDDYCDCEQDGTDEPGTNACNMGNFYCKIGSKVTGSIPSHRVNDGICDCCDGSDEWNGKHLFLQLPGHVQKKLGQFQTPCPNVC